MKKNSALILTFGHKETFTKVKNKVVLIGMPSFLPFYMYIGGISQEGAPIPNEVGSGQNPTLENQQNEQGKAVSDESRIVGGNPDVVTKMPISQTQTQIRPKTQLPTSQQAQNVNSTSASKKMAKAAPTIPFQMLMPILRPHLDKDRDMQLQQIFTKLRVC